MQPSKITFSKKTFELLLNVFLCLIINDDFIDKYAVSRGATSSVSFNNDRKN